MNRLTKVLMTLLPIGALLFSFGCKETPVEVEEPIKSIINIDTVELSADSNGGSFTVEYTITSPTEGNLASAKADVDWITDINTEKYGIIKFNVAASDVEEERMATITVSYPNAKSVPFFVVQKPATILGGFDIDLLEQSYNYCYVSVTPDDLKAKYLVGLFTWEEYETFDLESDNNLFNYHIEQLVDAGSWMGYPAEASIDMSSRTGIIANLKLSGLIAGEKYLFMACYYDTETFELIGDISRLEFYAKTPETQERNFDFEVAVDSSDVTITVTPEEAVGSYYFDVMPRVVIDRECVEFGLTLEEYFKGWWASVSGTDIGNGTTPSTIVDNYCSKGVDEGNFELLAETEYYVFAFEVNSEAACVSEPKYEVFTTGSVAPADLNITLNIFNLTSCGVRIDIEASNNTDPYVAGLTTKDIWDSFGSSEEAILAGLLDTYSHSSSAYGNGYFEEKKNLTPDTTYVFYAFGYKGGVATTKLFSVEFTTLNDEPSESDVFVKLIGYFNAKDIKALDPNFIYDGLDENGFAVCPIELVSADEDASLFYYNWHITPDYDLAWVTKDNRKGRMLYWNERPRYLWTIVAYDTEAWFAALAIDSEGYFSNEYLYQLDITRNGISDAQLFIDWMAAHPEAEPDPSQYIDYYAGLED